MNTLAEAFKHSACYCGERGHWLLVMGTNRDADCLTRSNFRSLVKHLGGESENVAIERASHWACGWVEYLIINPAMPELAAKAEAALERIDSYPVFDEDDFSELETEEANQIWENCYDIAERVEYIRTHRSQFEFHGLGDMLECVRGKYFAGYASELIQ